MVHFEARLLRIACLWLLTYAAVILLLTSEAGQSRALEEADEKVQDFIAWVGRVGVSTYSSAGTNSSTAPKAKLAAGGRIITVGKSGSGAQFSSVQDAVDSVPSGNSQRVVIQIGAGLYQEKVHVPSSKPYVTFQGAGAGSTTISWHDVASSSGGMPNSATVTIAAHSFIARGVTFQNAAPAPPVGSTNKQAVALRVSGDRAAFYSCSFLAHQDTLFDEEGKHYFENCLIEGSVDFICGNGQSLYKGCELRALQRSTESLTAQRRASPSESTGFSFVDCTVTGAGMAYLGRAWGPYSRVVFSFTSMNDVIKPQGWYNWGDSSRDSKVFFGQYKCSGPGAVESERVGWSHELSDAQAAPFQSLSFIDGASWLES